MSTTTSANEHSKRSLAAHLGLDISTIRSRLKPFLPTGDGQKARYNLKQVIRAFASDVGGSDEEIGYGDQLKIALTRKAETDTREKEIKLQERCGELVHKSVAVEMVHKVVMPLDQWLLTFADQVEFTCGLSGAQMQCVNKLIREQRSVLLANVSA